MACKDTTAVSDEPLSGKSDGKGSSRVPVSEETKKELTVPQDFQKEPVTEQKVSEKESISAGTKQKAAEKEPIPSMTIKQEAKDHHYKNEVAGAKILTLSKDATPKNQEKTNKVDSKRPTSRAEQAKLDIDSTSDSEAESERKPPNGTSSGTSVFKPFSRKVKALGSKTEIKINIRQEVDKTGQSKEGKADDDSKKSDSHKNSADSSKKESQENESRRCNGRQGGHVYGQGLIPDLGLGPVPGTAVDGPGHILDPQDDVEAGHVPILEDHIGGDHIPVPDTDQEVDHIPVPEEGQEVGHIPASGEDLGIHPIPIPVLLRLQKERKAMVINKN